MPQHYPPHHRPTYPQYPTPHHGSTANAHATATSGHAPTYPSPHYPQASSASAHATATSGQHHAPTYPSPHGASSSNAHASSSGHGSAHASASASSSGYHGHNYFNFWNPWWAPTRPPHIHKGGGIYINHCHQCANYGDDVDDKPTDKFTACMGFIESLDLDGPLRVDELADFTTQKWFATDADREANARDSAPVVLLCCHRLYQQRMFQGEEQQQQYPEAAGLGEGYTCQSVVDELMNMLLGNVPIKSAAADSE